MHNLIAINSPVQALLIYGSAFTTGAVIAAICVILDCKLKHDRRHHQQRDEVRAYVEARRPDAKDDLV